MLLAVKLSGDQRLLAGVELLAPTMLNVARSYLLFAALIVLALLHRARPGLAAWRLASWPGTGGGAGPSRPR